MDVICIHCILVNIYPKFRVVYMTGGGARDRSHCMWNYIKLCIQLFSLGFLVKPSTNEFNRHDIIKWKKNHHTVGKVWNLTDKSYKETKSRHLNTHPQDRWLSWCGTGTSVESGEVRIGDVRFVFTSSCLWEDSCLFVYVLCCVFVLFVFALCTLCC